jgi:hypothetical protein
VLVGGGGGSKQPMRARLRSRHPYIDKYLQELDDVGDSYADLEDWIVY